MSIFISHQSALEYWQKTSPSVIAKLKRSNVQNLYFSQSVRNTPTAIYGAKDGSRQLEKSRSRCNQAPDLSAVAHLSEPIHILVPTANARKRPGLFVSHVYGHEVLRNAFYKVSKDVYVSVPEWCFIQMAVQLNDVQLAMLGLQLCGTYVLSSLSPTGFESHDAITCKKALQNMVARQDGNAGVSRARRVLKWVADGAASPMESVLVLMLCLPARMGGYGFEMPELNYRLDAQGRNRAVTDRQYYVCDLYWSQHSLDVEYDSKQWHSSYNQVAKDAERRDALLAMGVRVETISLGHLHNVSELNRKALQIAQVMGKRLQTIDPAHDRKRRMLLNQLMGRMPQHPF